MSTDYIDHERLILNQFICAGCQRPLDLVELRVTREERLREPGRVDLLAVCHDCKRAWTKDEWDEIRGKGCP